MAKTTGADEGCLVRDVEITLISPEGAPFRFTVVIRRAEGDSVCLFEVTGAEPVTNSVKTHQYALTSREHNSYLNLFDALARDFGTLLPRNRQKQAKGKSRVPFRALLTENIAPGILYGYGDPAVLRVEEGTDGNRSVWYYLVVTSNDAPDSFPILRSRDFTGWEHVGFVFPQGRKPEWAADGGHVSDYWAPEIHRFGDEFRVYFVARDKSSHKLCIGMARSSHPCGPFNAAEEPILTNDVIDPHVFVEDDGTALLFWKEDNNAVWPSRLNRLLHEHARFIVKLFPNKEDQITASFAQTLWPWIQTLEPMERFLVQQILIETVVAEFPSFYDRLSRLLEEEGNGKLREDICAVHQFMRTPVFAQALSPDGTCLVGERTRIIENDQAWEGHLVEGMWVTKHRGMYCLFYAGNDFSTDKYGIGFAVADSPLGPYRKLPEPLLSSTAEWSGPGHPSVAVGPDGEMCLFLHAFFPGRTGYKEFRALLALPLKRQVLTSLLIRCGF